MYDEDDDEDDDDADEDVDDVDCRFVLTLTSHGGKRW